MFYAFLYSLVDAKAENSSFWLFWRLSCHSEIVLSKESVFSKVLCFFSSTPKLEKQKKMKPLLRKLIWNREVLYNIFNLRLVRLVTFYSKIERNFQRHSFFSQIANLTLNFNIHLHVTEESKDSYYVFFLHQFSLKSYLTHT